MKIENDKVVSLSYELHSEDDNKQRIFVEKQDAENPLVFIFGNGNLLPVFEENLSGKAIGDTFAFSIDAVDAYGEFDKDSVVDLPIDLFKQDGILMMDILKIGSSLPMADQDGNQLMGKIIAITGDAVTMDFNHPLAGKPLHFTGEVIEIREANPEELEHGHVHGAGGHHH
jgi:FKBP-type peptidyl-prolyl cis-trans isomerase SlyD